jgi:hypothetical protein
VLHAAPHARLPVPELTKRYFPITLTPGIHFGWGHDRWTRFSLTFSEYDESSNTLSSFHFRCLKEMVILEKSSAHLRHRYFELHYFVVVCSGNNYPGEMLVVNQ